MWTLLVTLVLGLGCDAGNHKTATVVALSQSHDAQVVVYCSGDGARNHVNIRWNETTVFSAKPPNSKSSMKMPFELLVILSDSGSHVLEVECDGESKKVAVLLREGDKRHFVLLMPMEDRPLLIKDMGTKPLFF